MNTTLAAIEIDALKNVRECGYMFIGASRDKETLRKRRLAIRRLNEMGLVEPVYGEAPHTGAVSHRQCVSRLSLTELGSRRLAAAEAAQ